MNRHDEYLLAWVPEDVAKTDVGTVHIWTIICRTGSMTRIAETMIFIAPGKDVAGLTDRDCERGPVEQAQQQHDRWVAKVRQAVQA
jgi:hypothetical protein